MVGKTLGYVLSGIGMAVIAVGTIPAIRNSIKLIPESISDLYVMSAGAIIIAAGLFILVKNPSSKQPAEVPIYDGKNNVVGFRRMKK